MVGLPLVHGLTAVLYGPAAKLPWTHALLFSRGIRMRILAGGQYGPLVAEGQVWRLVRSVFLHADALHLVVNIAAIGVLGRLLEPQVGTRRLLLLFVASGTIGSVASQLTGQLQSDGASGGAYGLLVACIVTAWSARATLDPDDRRLFLRVLPAFLLVNLLVSGLHPAIDLFAHLGGGLAGLAVLFPVRPRVEALLLGALLVLAIGGPQVL